MDVFFTLVIIDTHSKIQLPPSLNKETSQFFENILFVVFDHFDDDLKNEFYQFSEDEASLPENVLHLKQTELWQLNQIIGYFDAKKYSKIFIFSDQSLKELYDQMTKYKEQQIKEVRLIHSSPNVLSLINEDQMVYKCQKEFTLSQSEKLLVEPVLNQVFDKMQYAPKEVPLDTFSFLKFLNNIINEANKKKIKNEIDFDKVSSEVFFELVTNNFIKLCPELYYLVVSRQLRCFNDFSKILQLEITYSLSLPQIDQLFDKMTPLTEQNNNKINLQLETAKTLQSQESIQDYQKLQFLMQQNTYSTGLSSFNSPAFTSSEDSTPLKVVAPIQQQIKNGGFNNNSQIHQTKNNSFLFDDPSLNKSFNASQEQVPINLQPTWFEYIKDVTRLFFESFEKSNMIQTQKVVSLNKCMINFALNWIKKKESTKVKSELVISFLELLNSKKDAYANLATFNVFLFLHLNSFLEFKSDKEVFYDVEKIKAMAKNTFEHLYKQTNIVYTLKVGVDFEKNPYKVMKEQLKINVAGSKLKSGSSTGASTTMETVISQRMNTYAYSESSQTSVDGLSKDFRELNKQIASKITPSKGMQQQTTYSDEATSKQNVKLQNAQQAKLITKQEFQSMQNIE
eukprot:403358937